MSIEVAHFERFTLIITYRPTHFRRGHYLFYLYDEILHAQLSFQQRRHEYQMPIAKHSRRLPPPPA